MSASSWSGFDRLTVLALIALWALIYLPNLRTNPNWYGDEGIVLEEAITLSKGIPRYGPIELNFLIPNPHPPLYLLALALPMKFFGPDIVYGRALQACVGISTAALAFWVGSLLIGRKFGFLCAAILLTYPEAALHYRWVRGHPMQGMISLACVGFLIRYLQCVQRKDVLFASLMATLALGVHYFALPLILMVAVTAWAKRKSDLPLSLGVCMLFPALFAGWIIFFQSNDGHGIFHQLGAAFKQGLKTSQPSPLEELWRIYRTILEFIFLTPTVGPRDEIGSDLWITGGFLGLCLFPNKRLRTWLVFFACALMAGVFIARDNPVVFMYRTFAFLPLFAVGLAGGLHSVGLWLAQFHESRRKILQLLPASMVLMVCGAVSTSGSLGHMVSKIDRWTVQSSSDAEQVMNFVNSSTGPEDFVVMPDQLFWLYHWNRKAQLIHCAKFDFGIEENSAIGVPPSRYWFEPRIANAKYLVLAAGRGLNGVPVGIDAVFWLGYEGPRRVFEKVQQEKWPVVFQSGEYSIFSNPRFQKPTP
jgi:hypothetical protein